MLHGINIKFYLPSPPEVYIQAMKNEKSEVAGDFNKLHVNKTGKICLGTSFGVINKG